MKEQKRAAIYARVSTVGAGQDPGMQLAELREYASAEVGRWQVSTSMSEFLELSIHAHSSTA